MKSTTKIENIPGIHGKNGSEPRNRKFGKKFKEETLNRSAIFEKICKICEWTVGRTSESLSTWKNMIIREIVAKNENIFEIHGKP